MSNQKPFSRHTDLQHKHSGLTDEIISAFYAVYNTLGYGFLEKVYEKALLHELIKRGFEVMAQVPVKVIYDNVIVGDYLADLLVNDIVILEIKCADAISEAHKAQLLNYLKATGKEVGLILNFGPEPKVSRRVN